MRLVEHAREGAQELLDEGGLGVYFCLGLPWRSGTPHVASPPPACTDAAALRTLWARAAIASFTLAPALLLLLLALRRCFLHAGARRPSL